MKKNKPLIILTSFKGVQKFHPPIPDRQIHSVAVYQPKGCRYPELDFCKIIDGLRKEWILPREFEDLQRPLDAYRGALWWLYTRRLPEFQTFTKYSLQPGSVHALCCWCPHERAAQRQLRQFGSFVCHTMVLGEFLDKKFENTITVQLDADRVTRGAPVLTQWYTKREGVWV